MTHYLPLPKAFGLIFTSLLITLANYSLYTTLSKYEKKTLYITHIASESATGSHLPVDYLAELMKLSVDHPKNLSSFPLSLAENRLLTSPFIKTAYVNSLPPNALFVRYAIREPVAKVGNYDNVGIDEEGFLFPLVPFFTKKKLPLLFFSTKDLPKRENGPIYTQVKSIGYTLAKDLFSFLCQKGEEEGVRIRLIDVSRAFSLNRGKREVVVILHTKEGLGEHILRLHPKECLNQIGNYFSLKKNLLEEKSENKAHLIDLRNPGTAYLEKVTLFPHF